MVLAASGPPQRPSNAEPPRPAPVYLGGVTADMAALSDPARSAVLRAAGGGFYAHESYVLEHTAGTCPAQIASPSLAATIRNFAATPPPLAEVGFNTPEALIQLIRCNYGAVGLHPGAALVNIDMASTGPDGWNAFVAAGRTVGLRRLGPIISPNLRSDPQDWDDPHWSAAKAMARAGGALGMDTPPLLHRILGEGYVRFARQQLAWCAANHVRCIDIVSPADNENTFTADVLDWKRRITTGRHAGPAAWVVENYNAGTRPSIDAANGSPSLLDAALALARAAPAATDHHPVPADAPLPST